MIKKNKLAFSLIEISVVIIVIGILVATISQSKKLIAQIKINTARSNTLSSPVFSTAGLIGWWESTLDKSFSEEEQQDLLSVSQWFDLNSPSPVKFNFSQTNTNLRPIYILQGTNSLPILEFNGNNYLETSYHSILNPLNFTIFLVAKNNNFGSSNQSTILCNNTNNRGFAINSYLNGSSPNYQILIGTGNSLATHNLSISSTFNKIDVLTITFNSSNLNAYLNSVNALSVNSNFAININTKLTIGANNCNESNTNHFRGQIAEIIFFDRNIKSSERLAIEKYLIRKWGVLVN